MSNLPDLRALAATRLRAHEGDYTIVNVGGCWCPVQGWDADGRLLFQTPTGATGWTEPDAQPVNAAHARAIPLDVAEEMADVWNLLGLQLTKPDDNGEPISDAAQYEVRQLQQIALCFDYRLRRLWALLPESHRQDRYPVERDEVAGCE